MQGEGVPKSPTRSNGLGYNIFQAGCTPHVETSPKVRAGADTNVINSLNFSASAPRAPVCGRRIGLRPWEVSSPTGRMPGTIPPAVLPWEHITTAEESWDGCRGTRMKGSRRVLLLSPSWHCTKAKQAMKPDHSACFSLPGIRIQIKSPPSPPSSVWPVVLQPPGGLPLLF